MDDEVQVYDIIYSNSLVGTVLSTVTSTMANQSVIVQKLQVSLDSDAGLATVTVKLLSGTITVQEVTVTPSSPTYVEQHDSGVLRIGPNSSLVLVTEGGTSSVTIGYYFVYGRVSTT